MNLECKQKDQAGDMNIGWLRLPSEQIWRDEKEYGLRPQHFSMCRWEIKEDSTKKTRVMREVEDEPGKQCSGCQEMFQGS